MIMMRRLSYLLLILCIVGIYSSIKEVEGHEYVGCYRDSFSASERDLIGSLLLNNEKQNLISPDHCEEYCGARGFKYVGVQYGSECWCGNSYGRHGALDEKECSVPCVGGTNIPPNRCGGALANSIYRVTKQFEKPSTQANDNRPLLGLVMIVKDEAHTLPNTLAPLAPYLDAYYILDTGSTDGTQDAIRRTLGADKGTIFEEPFIDYGRSRNRALELAQTAPNPPIFSLMLSADETVHHPEALRAFCEEYRNAEGAMHEAYPIQMDVGWKFDSMRLSRTDKGWRYVGRVHEYLAAPDQKWRPSIRVPKAFIQFRVTDPERRGKREYKIRDILLEEVREKPTDTRASFYLARTYNVIGNHSAALKEFQRRIALGGWQEEVYESYYAIAFQLEALGRPWSEVHEAFLDAHAHSPERGEPLFNIAQHYYKSQNKKALAYPYAAHCASLPYPKDAVLWVQADVYNWQCLMYQGLTGALTKHYYDGYVALLKALRVHPDDSNMLRVKGDYESHLNEADRTKAECAAGVKTGDVCGSTICTKEHVAPSGSISLLDRMKSEQPGEQSNAFVSKDKSLANQHIPDSLLTKYTGVPSYGTDANRHYALLGFLGGMILVLLLSFLFKQFHLTTWLSLKLFGGKKSGAGHHESGGKFV